MTTSGTSEVQSDVADKVAGSSFVLMARRMVLLATAAVSTLLVTRFLEPEGYGVLQSAIATWSIVLAFCDFGVSLSLGRDLAVQTDRRGALLRAAYRTQAIACAVMTVAFLTFALISGIDTDRGLILLILTPSIATSAFVAGRALFLARFETRQLVRIDVVVSTVQVIAMVIAAGIWRDPVWVAVAVSIGTMANATWVGVAAARSVEKQKPTRQETVSVIKRAAPLGLMGAMSKVYLNIDLAIIGGLVAAADLGYYAAAVKMLTLLATFPGLIMNAALPGLSSVKDDPEALRRLTTRVLHWLLITGFPLFLLVGLFGDTFSTIAFGDDFEKAGQLVGILCIAGATGVFSQFLGTILVAASVVRPLLYQNAVAVIVNVGANLWLVPKHGVAAAAWITVLTEGIVCLGSLYTARRVLKLSSSFVELWRPLVCVLAGTIVALVLLSQPWLGIPLASITFLGAVLLLKCWPDELHPRKLLKALK